MSFKLKIFDDDPIECSKMLIANYCYTIIIRIAKIIFIIITTLANNFYF